MLFALAFLQGVIFSSQLVPGVPGGKDAPTSPGDQDP